MARVKTRLYDGIRQEKPYFQEQIDIRDLFSIFVVEPQRMFDRIRAQSSAFLISAFHERSEPREVLRWNRNTPIYSYEALVVPQVSKKSMLKDLSLLNVRRETLFPSVDETAKAVTQDYSGRSDAFDRGLTPEF